MNKSFNFTINECNQTFNFSEIITSPSIIISFCIASTINLWIFGSCLFVIIILLKTKNKRFDATRKFLINLAITDFGFACFLMPISIAYIILKVNWIPCYVICHLWIISDVYFCSTNMFNLVVIALDRMMAVNYAVKYNQIMSNTRVRLLILLIWMLALLITLPLFINLLWNYYATTTTTQKVSTIDTADYYYHYSYSYYSYNTRNKCLKHPCSLINVSVYIRVFITISAVYTPTILICYFYFHVFSKVVLNKRGISIGLLIDNERVSNKKSDRKSTTMGKSNTDNKNNNNDNNTNSSDDQGDVSGNNNNNKNNGNNKSNLSNKRNYKSNCGLLRVHVGGRPFQMNHISNTTVQTTLTTPTTPTATTTTTTTTTTPNYHYHSSISINKPTEDTSQQQQQEGIGKKNEKHSSSITLNSSSTHQHQSPHENQSQLCITTGLVRKERHESDCGPSRRKFNELFLSELEKSNYKSKSNKKLSSTLSEITFKINRNKLDVVTPNQQQQPQQPLKRKLKNILRKHSFHTLSSEVSLKPLDLAHSRRSTGKSDKDAKFTDISTLRRCALMPLHPSAAWSSSISNEYIYSARNSENISGLSITQMTPRNSNPIDQFTLPPSYDPPLSPSGCIISNQHTSNSNTTFNSYRIKVKHTIEIKAICMYLINISSILLCWLPFYTLILFTDYMPSICLSLTIYDIFYWLKFACIAINPIIYGSASEDLRKAFKRFILHCGKVKKEKKALKRLVLAGLGAAGIPYGHRIIIPPQKCNNTTTSKSVVFNKPLMVLTDTEE